MNSEKTCKDCGKPSKTFIKCFACNQKGKPKKEAQEEEDNDIILTTLQLAKLKKAIASGGLCRIVLCGGSKPSDPVKIVVEREPTVEELEAMIQEH